MGALSYPEYQNSNLSDTASVNTGGGTFSSVTTSWLCVYILSWTSVAGNNAVIDPESGDWAVGIQSKVLTYDNKYLHMLCTWKIMTAGSGSNHLHISLFEDVYCVYTSHWYKHGAGVSSIVAWTGEMSPWSDPPLHDMGTTEYYDIITVVYRNSTSSTGTVPSGYSSFLKKGLRYGPGYFFTARKNVYGSTENPGNFGTQADVDYLGMTMSVMNVGPYFEIHSGKAGISIDLSQLHVTPSYYPDYVLRTWNSSGLVTFDGQRDLAALVFRRHVGAADEGSVVIPELEGRLSFEMSIPRESEAETTYKGSHLVWRDGTTIHWKPFFEASISPCLSTILVFLYR